MWTVTHDAGNHVVWFRNNKNPQVLLIQYISSWVHIYRECKLAVETRRDSFSSLIPHREAFIDPIDLSSTPVAHSCVVFFFKLWRNHQISVKSSWRLSKWYKKLFSEQHKRSRKKTEEHYKNGIGVPIARTQWLRWGSTLLRPPSLAQLITEMSLQGNTSKSVGFLLLLARSGRKILFKAKKKACMSAWMHGTRWSKQGGWK